MLLTFAEYLGIFAFAYSGFSVGLRHRLDLLGLGVSAFLTALGGGLIRDLLADRPPYALTHEGPALSVLLILVLLILFHRRLHHELESRTLFIFIDALGLASFAVSGALVGREAGFNGAGITLLAFITAVGGGLLRDILINRVPYLLRGGFYGIVALILGIAIAIFDRFGILNDLSVLALFTAGVLLRMWAWKQKWNLPTLG